MVTAGAATVVVALGAGVPAVAAVDSGGGDSARSSYIVALRGGGDAASLARDHASRYAASVTQVYRFAAYGYAANMTAAQARRVAADPAVAAVLPDLPVHATGQQVPPGIDRVDADLSSTAAGDGRGSVDVDIAVIDTGIDPRHRDLNVVGGVNCIQGGSSFADLNGHGTHVAGTAAAKDDRQGVVGVAPGARLWAVRVLDANGSGLLSTIMCGVDWVTAHADVIDVANMSLGGGGPEGSCTDGGFHAAICRSVAAGVTYVVAAGNAGADAGGFVPARYDEVVTVSAITDFDGKPGGVGTPTCSIGHDDTFAHFSNYGSEVDLTAPGVCVRSTWRGGGYASISGTSMASPHVAGAAALYVSSHPDATPAQVAAALRAAGTSDWTGDPDGTHEPLVNVATF